MSYDENKVQDLIETAARLSMVIGPGEAGALNELRVALQGIAMLDGVPGDLARVAMKGAKRIRAIAPDADDLAEQLAPVVAAIEDLQQALDPESAGSEQSPSASAPQDSGDSRSDQKDAVPESAGETFDGCDDPLMDEFLSEAEEHLDAAEENLLTIESEPTDDDALNAVFRSFHTIKGGAGILEVGALSTFAHRAESMLDLARNAEIELVGAKMDLCYRALDVLKGLVAGLRTGAAKVPLPEDYRACLVELEAVSTGDEPASRGGSPDPVVEVSEDAPATTAKAPADAVPSQEPVAGTPVPESDAPRPKTDKAKKKNVGSVKIAMDRLDNMINLVGELVITTAMVQQEVGSAATTGGGFRSIAQLEKVTNELQAIAMSMRMVPLKATFQKAARMVRDVASKCGKSVAFASDGGDTELDRNVVEKLGDPLIHMLRNAVDHGIEPAEKRLENGKPVTGTVKLSAYHQGGSVVIELRDDGGGMNRAGILKKAVGNGLVTEAQATAMPDEEVWPLIFHPGLSTTEKLSEVSGRGVGMDVVKKNIEALRGVVEIQSEPGFGSRFIIRLPLTLAIIDAMVVAAGDRRYILPTLSVQSFLRPESEQIFTYQGRGEMVNVREQVIPLYRLQDLLGLPSNTTDASEGLLAITSAEGEDFALMVDDLYGQQQVVIKSMGTGEDPCPGIAGAAILGDGTVGLILDVDGLARIAREGSPTASQSS